jgi:hypothetical protein
VTSTALIPAAPYGEVARVRERMRRHQQDLEEAVGALRRVARRRATAAYYLENYPWHILIAAGLVGAWLGRER